MGWKGFRNIWNGRIQRGFSFSGVWEGFFGEDETEGYFTIRVVFVLSRGSFYFSSAHLGWPYWSSRGLGCVTWTAEMQTLTPLIVKLRSKFCEGDGC